MIITKLLHASLLVKDTDTALQFYQGILGLELDSGRPDLGYPGAWLNIGEQQIHLLELPNPDPLTGRPDHGGRDRHVAFQLDSIDELKQRLDEQGLSYTLSKSGRKALFCRDPDANALEFVEG
ncbi:MAG: VOC family protein [Gammaproteobacteria bacterium]|nr:VOC family protein [Gammaproteobacteria bacterium]MDH5776873.1 VOC family protein [Gammaproteobacteria bacterium]